MGDALAPWHIIILVIVLVVLFGARRLPGAAKSLGESMHIFKKSVQGLNPDDDPASAANPTGQSFMAQPVSGTPLPPASIGAPDQTAQQLADLQRQVADLQRQSAGPNGGPVSEAQSTQPF
jgi:sec-independent protein translocase protein TatA